MPGSFVKNVGTVVVSNATTAVLTIPAAGVALGNLVIVRAVRQDGAATVSSIVDTGGNSYARFESKNGVSPATEVWASLLTVALVSGNTLTLTWSSKGGHDMGVDEFSGLFAVEDSTSSTSTGTSTTPSATMTPALNGLVIGAVGVANGASDTITEDTDTTNGSWVSLTVPPSTGSVQKLRGAYKLLTASGSQTYNPTLGTSRTWNECIVAFSPPDTARDIAVVAPSVAVHRSANW